MASALLKTSHAWFHWMPDCLRFEPVYTLNNITHNNLTHSKWLNIN